jgi:hypothetical protein
MPVSIEIRASCTWPGCDLGGLSMTLRVQPKEPKAASAYCPLCARELSILSAAPIVH